MLARRTTLQGNMTGRHRTDERNLTGVWHGLYTYASGRTVTFVATLIESGSHLGGSTHEPCATTGLGTMAFAMLSGSRKGSAVTFVKTYDGAGPEYENPVAYDGALNDDATEIEGRWQIRGLLSGRFLMIRSSGKAESVERKASLKA
jgi:hypothetical protein